MRIATNKDDDRSFRMFSRIIIPPRNAVEMILCYTANGAETIDFIDGTGKSAGVEVCWHLHDLQRGQAHLVDEVKVDIDAFHTQDSCHLIHENTLEIGKRILVGHTDNPCLVLQQALLYLAINVQFERIDVVPKDWHHIRW